MRAITVVPGKQGSARLDDLPEPDPAAGAVLVQALALGVCGTDLEITGGRYGWAPPGRERLVLGHESLGRVIEAPGGGELARGDLVAGIVRRGSSRSSPSRSTRRPAGSASCSSRPPSWSRHGSTSSASAAAPAGSHAGC